MKEGVATDTTTGGGPNPVDSEGLCLLSLDGGGVRGLSTLYILKGIMKRLNDERKETGLPSKKPCEIFDLIGGTSTGGLIAIMLGRLEMDVDECILAYVNLMKGVFEKKSSRLPVSLRGRVKAQFDSEKLRAALEQAISQTGASPTDRFNDGQTRGCRVFVCATAKETTETTRLKGYDLRGKSGIDATIIDAALATSAATGFFDPVHIGARQFVDGGLGANNPVEQVEREASDIWCDNTGQLMPLVKCFISVGTGHPGKKAIEDNMLKFLSRTLVDMATETDKTEASFIARWRQLYDSKRYFRFNVHHGLESVGLEEYKQQGTIEAATESYLNHRAQDVLVRDCVENLKQKQKTTPIGFSSIIDKYNHAILLDALSDIQKPCYYIQFAKNPRFIARTAILDELDRFFGDDSYHRLALVGLGGVGKTQIALRFAYQVKEKWPDYSIYWVPLLSDESAEQAFTEIAAKLDLKKSHEDEDVKALARSRRLFPASDNGMLLLTTRSRLVAEEFAGSYFIEVEQMGPTEATALFREHVNRKIQLQDEVLVAKLLEYLTFLPLAITQAASYLNQTRVPIRKYFMLLQEAEKGLPSVLGRDFKDATRYKGSRNAVGKTWLMSFQQIEQSDQVATRLLSFLSCIEPKAIPQHMLPDAGTEEIEFAVGLLSAYSFLARRGDTDMLDMHSLVHMATRGWVEVQGWINQAVNDGISHLVKVFPSNTHATRELRREYLPHATRLLEQDIENRSSDTYRLCEQVGNHHYTDRRFKEAVKCYETVCWWKQSQLADDDSNRLYSEHSLASAYLADRRIKDAIKIFEHVVAVRKETLDEKDHDRLASEHELASAYLQDRRIKDAIKIFEHVVAVLKEALDEKDHNRLASEHALASAYLDDRRIKDAIKIFEHVVAVEKETLDEKDHSRLTSKHALASAYLDDRRIKDAIKIFKHVVAVRKETLDEKDHDRLASEHSLASAYLDDRRIKDAIKIFEHVVAVRKETLDEKDYDRLASEHELARAYLQDRRIKDAIEIFEHVVAVKKETLNKKDHSRLASEHSLARAYLKDRRIKDAITIFKHVVAVRKETLNKKDHDRLASEYELARAYFEDRRIQDAITIFEHVVAVGKETLDEKDYSRLVFEHSLANAYLDDRRINDAITILEHVVAVRKETLDEKDHSRLASEQSLASAYRMLNM